MMRYLFPKQLLYLHKRIIEETGGSDGIRDHGLLESAVYRPQATFSGEELYPELLDKAAAMGHSLINNHPFVDGNKRVGWAAMRLMLRLNGYHIEADDDTKYDWVIQIAQGKISLSQMKQWLTDHAKKIQG
ncbi:MAG: type II toxin-antitoxin system death-on-curing family toxin [Candidatus Omnitrophica bacterium]|nr:type II toxin-antitoxin system death-on-curing family toxin [Candidatus Omnitrophota bacterium]